MLGGLGIFLFTSVHRMALGPTQPPVQQIPGDLSLGVKQLGHEDDHSPSSSSERETQTAIDDQDSREASYEVLFL